MKKGFTLIELLTVIAIIGILSGISFSALKSGGKTFALTRSAHALATEIRKAQEMAMAMKREGGNIPPGYGIYISLPQTVILFADNGNHIYEDGVDTKIEDFRLETNVSIQSIELTVDSLAETASSVNIVFDPPHPSTTIISPSFSNVFDEAEINLFANGLSKKIRVNRAGLISVE